MSKRVGKAERKRQRRHSAARTKLEVVAFRRGLESHRRIVGPSIKRRAALVGAALGFAFGVGLTYYMLG